jgi:broad specificity phosphatase PhoE
VGAIYLVRHAQASYAARNYDALSELGRRQAHALGEALRGRLPAPDRVVAGTLRRQIDTAHGCLAALGHPAEVVEDAAWNEFDHEELLRLRAGATDVAALYDELERAANPRAAFQQLFVEAIARWIGGGHDHEYRESWPAFRARAVAALDALVASLAPSQNVLVVSSGGPIGQIIAHHLGLVPERGMALTATLANCGVTKIVYGRSRGVFVSTLNEHGWFEGDARALLTYR